MAAPTGALQRAVLLAVPLGLVALIFATPALLVRERPPPTAIPFVLVQIAKEVWNATYNETALLYVRDALATPTYDYLAISATGTGNYTGTHWSSNGTRAPSVWLKFPMNATNGSPWNVTAIAVQGSSTYRYNATIDFRFDQGWILRVTPEGETGYRDYSLGSVPFSAPMKREVP